MDGTVILTPSVAKQPVVVVQAWTRCNNIVVTWIPNYVSPNITVSMTYRNSALDVWNNLREMFSQGNGPQVFQLQKDLSGISQAETFVSDYCSGVNIGPYGNKINIGPILSIGPKGGSEPNI